MARNLDSDEFKNQKKETTQKFIFAVENGGTKNGPKLIEQELHIGDGTGSTWCKYKRGERSWPFPSLHQNILNAEKRGYISKMKAQELISYLPPEYHEDITNSVTHAYTFDATELFYLDIKKTTELLITQITELRKRIKYGHVDLENAHYLNTSINLLQPLINYIQEQLNSKLEEENRLFEGFGTRNYMDIAQTTAPQSTTAWDVGYTSYWWTKPPLTPDEKIELQRRLYSNEIDGKFRQFMANNGGSPF